MSHMIFSDSKIIASDRGLNILIDVFMYTCFKMVCHAKRIDAVREKSIAE